MGSKGSKARKQAAAESHKTKSQPKKPPKPLSAVSEGEESAWSSAHQMEGEGTNSGSALSLAQQQQSAPPLAKPPPSPARAESKSETTAESLSSLNAQQQQSTRIESATSMEEKDDYPAAASTSTTKQDEDHAPANVVVEHVAIQQEEEQLLQTYEAEPLVEAPPPREPTPDPLQSGGYLLFSPSNDGMLYLQYSAEKISEAVAYFRPKKVIPAFKFRQNAGRVELIRKLQTNKQLYYDGFADFLKAAREFDSDIYLMQNTAKVYYQVDGSKVVEAPFQDFFSVRVNNIAVIPPLNKSFDGVKQLHPDQFISTGNKYGKALKF